MAVPGTTLRLPYFLLLVALLSACAPRVPTPTAAPASGTSGAPQAAPAPNPSPQTALLARLPAAQADAFRAGYAALAAADPAEAERAFEGLAQLSLPSEAAAEARLRLGEAQAGAGHAEAALATLDEVQRRFAGTPQAGLAPYFVALATQAAGRADDARQRLADYAAGHPQVAAAVWLRVAEDDLKRGQPAPAAEAARQGLASAQARGLRAALLERLGEAESALGHAQAAFDAYRQTLALAQGKSYLGEQLYHLAQAYQGIGKREEAVRALQSAARDFPAARTTADTLRLLGEL
ncbi:MAG: hypothetical protein HY690_13760 [Chloroflexi bacterium]|nr:hypothetical protein [Chloroflexota bacterium]